MNDIISCKKLRTLKHLTYIGLVTDELSKYRRSNEIYEIFPSITVRNTSLINVDNFSHSIAKKYQPIKCNQKSF